MWPFNKPAAMPVDTKSVPPSGTAVPDSWLVEMFGASTGALSVSPAQALSVPAVANAVKVISESVATADLTVKRRVGDQETDVPDHPALALLKGQANGWTSGFELIRDLVSQALTQDAGGLAWVNRVGGRAAEIIRYDDGGITVAYSNKGTGEPSYRIGGKKVDAGDIIHVRSGFSRCPLSLCRDAISAAKQMELYVRAFWANSARPGGVIEFPTGVKIGDTGLAKMRAAWRTAFENSEAAGRTAILWDGASFKQMAMTSVDGQLLELRSFQIAEIARAFGIPQHMVGKLDRATWGNYSQAAREYLTSTVLPWMRAVEAALNRALLTDDERGEYRFAFDLDDFSQGDLGERATAISTLITARTINPNEARNWLGLPPRDGGNEFSNPAIEPAAPVADNQNNQPLEQEDAA